MLKLPKRSHRQQVLFVVAYALAFANLGLIGVDLYQKKPPYMPGSLAFVSSPSKDTGKTNTTADGSTETASNGSSGGRASDSPLVVKEADPVKEPAVATRPAAVAAPAPATTATPEPGRGSGDGGMVTPASTASAPVAASPAPAAAPAPAPVAAPAPAAPAASPTPTTSSPLPATIPSAGPTVEGTATALQGTVDSTLKPGL